MTDSLPRIGIDYTAAIHQNAGIGRSVRELVRALVATEPGIPLELFVAGGRGIDLPAPPGLATFHPAPLSERNLARLWYRLNLPIPVETWTGPLDLFHAADFALPPTRRGAKTIVTVHDLAFERHPDETMPGMLAHLRRVVPRSVQRADHIIAVSEATRRDVIELYAAPADKVTVIPHGVASRFHPHSSAQEIAATRAKFKLPDAPLILTVGTLQPRKNHLRLIQAFAQMPHTDATLVIAGGPGWSYDAVTREVERLNLRDRVIFTGHLGDDDLIALYHASTIFAYPALYEGFGLPVLEAMACGVPVLAANTSSLPEVTASAALLVDPLDVDAIATALSQLLTDDALRASLIEKGKARAHSFTWARAAQQTWDLYERLLAR
jgi:glycosyltransferase involved in cell wall biosynthesis